MKSRINVVNNMIINKTKYLNLPLKVASTAFQVGYKLMDYFKNNENLKNLTAIEKYDLISNTCIFISCKFEDIHGYLDKIVERIPDANVNDILQAEVDILKFLNFEFYYTNVFYKALGFKYVLDKYDKLDYNRILDNILKLFCSLDTEEYTLLEIVIAAVDSNDENIISCLNDLQIINFDMNKRIELRRLLNDARIYKHDEIKSILDSKNENIKQ